MMSSQNSRVQVPNINIDGSPTNDVSAPNPLSGRDGTDRSTTTKSKLLSCKNHILTATFNSRTIRETSRKSELIYSMSKHKIDILGIQEHRIIHQEPTRYERCNGHLLITSSAWWNDNQAAMGGVGILLGPKAIKALSGVVPFDNRILLANLTGNPKTTIIVTYSPTSASTDEEINGYYHSLRRCIDSVPAHSFLMVLGDLNARIGNDDARHTLHSSTKRNGKLLLDLVMEKDLIITNTYFRKRPGKLWTYIGPGGHKAQLDYIITRCKWRNSVLNCEAYNSFANVGSDHRVVTAKIKLSLKANSKAPTRRTTYDWKVFAKDPTLQEKYSVEVRNRFSALADENQTATEQYGHFIQVNKDVTAAVVPPLTRKKPLQINNDPRVVQVRNKAKEKHWNYLIDTSEENRLDYKQAKRGIDNTYAALLKEQLEDKIKRIEDADINGKHGQSWKLINEVTGRKASVQGKLEGDMQGDRINNWYKHFCNLLGKPPTVTDEDEEIEQIFTKLNIKEGSFTVEEYKKAKAELRIGRAAGDDEIHPEVLKLCNLDDIIHRFCNRAYTKRESPTQWKMSNLVCIPKAGDLSKGDNYRGISLSSLVFKTRNRMILHRIRPEVDKKLRINQNGFRPGHSTVSQILALRRIIEGVKSNNLPAIITFIDFTKAFDTIHRGKMIKILRAYGIPNELVEVIDRHVPRYNSKSPKPRWWN